MTASYRQRVRDWQRRQCVRDEEERSMQRCVRHHQTNSQSPRHTGAATSQQTLALVPLLCITINTTILSITTSLLFVHFFHLHVYIFYIPVQLTAVWLFVFKIKLNWTERTTDVKKWCSFRSMNAIYYQPWSKYKHSLTFRIRRYTHLQCIRL